MTSPAPDPRAFALRVATPAEKLRGITYGLDYLAARLEDVTRELTATIAALDAALERLDTSAPKGPTT